MNYQETLEYLYNRLPVFHIVGSQAYKPGLENTMLLMEALNFPHKKFRSVHIAGTNGKGSVSHYLAAIFQKSGYKTGLYTSPHLVDFGERIRVDGQMIRQDFVIDFVNRNMAVIEKIQPSFFELTMAMAFAFFAAEEVDVAIIEVGLGGRLDSTNIITPELSVITNIGFDHMDFLGDTLEKIASEKAGIIKPEIPVVIGEVLPETVGVFTQKVAEMNSDIIFAEKEFQVDFSGFEDTKMKVRVAGKEYISGLSGIYQLKNIGTVLAAVATINASGVFILPAEEIREGLEYVCEITGLRGRWEVIQDNPKIIADTAHNVHGVGQIVKQIQIQDYQTLRIVIGMVSDKDVNAVLKLLPSEAIYYFTQATTKRALSASSLQGMSEKYGLHGKSFPEVKKALDQAKTDSQAQDLILITGSNFIVGEALAGMS